METPEFSAIAPPYWSSRPVFLVGAGPSLEGFDFERLRGAGYVLAVKQAWKVCPFADAVFGLDRAWQTWARDDIASLAKRTPVWIAIPPESGTDWFRSIPGVSYLRRTDTSERLSDRPDTIDSGGTSGFGALNFAYLKRARTIVLLGYDYRAGHLAGLGHPERPADHNARYMRGWAESFARVAPQLDRVGCRVLNASPASQITAFPRMSIDAALAAVAWPGAQA